MINYDKKERKTDLLHIPCVGWLYSDRKANTDTDIKCNINSEYLILIKLC